MKIYVASQTRYPSTTYYDPELDQDVTVTDVQYRAQGAAEILPQFTWTEKHTYHPALGEVAQICMAEGDSNDLAVIRSAGLNVLASYDELATAPVLDTAAPLFDHIYRIGVSQFIRLDFIAPWRGELALSWQALDHRVCHRATINASQLLVERVGGLGDMRLAQITHNGAVGTQSLRVMSEGGLCTIRLGSFEQLFTVAGGYTGLMISKSANYQQGRVLRLRAESRTQEAYRYILEEI